jgi:hypothetical protein
MVYHLAERALHLGIAIEIHRMIWFHVEKSQCSFRTARTVLDLHRGRGLSDILRTDWSAILVGGIPTHPKNMSSSVGITTFPIDGKIKFMSQTTNQIWHDIDDQIWLIQYGFI